jgi:N-acetylglucosamine-6-sulfatase
VRQTATTVAKDPTSKARRLLAAGRSKLARLTSSVRDRYVRRSQRRLRGRPASAVSRRRWVRLSLVVALVGGGFALPSAGAEVLQPQASSRPNIILILADDLDFESASHMPNLRSLVTDQGIEFSNAFVSYSLCCPSRASILRGQYMHNHGVRYNNTPGGGFERFRNSGNQRSTIATWLQSDGYRTAFFGKYFNGYGWQTGTETYVPPGWDRWYGKLGAGYYDYHLNENGKVVSYGRRPQDYYTDVLAGKTRGYVRSAVDDPDPFFMYLAPGTPHGPFVAAPRHKGDSVVEKAPRTPSFGEVDVGDKPKWVRRLPRLDAQATKKIDETYAKRQRMLLSLDELIGDLVEALRVSGQLENTYIFFTSDNGFHLGEHRISLTKRTPYEETQRVPLVVRGPGVPAGQAVDEMTLNTDFAPTFAALAGVSAPSFVDGRSLEPLLDGTPPESWRKSILLENWKKHIVKRAASTYHGIRTQDYKYVEHAGGGRELYDLRSDPYELESMHEGADPALVTDLKARLAALKSCAGQSCRDAEDAP